MLTHIHHIAIICSDYEISKEFYVHTLGCRILKETYREERNSYKLDLAVGDSGQIELFSFPEPPLRPTQPEARGLRHLAFGTEDLDAEVARLAEQGVECEPVRIDELTGKRFTFFRDPDDLPLELYEN
ncbi:VOC family protein [Metabacillus sp. KIGAM252]|uniref:VOC family protein n=1 Tax=Metabacillus flavus TaxID=2823519 RepID=A0ABS5LJP7_9BACI|nr:VOC family protein [Metabacillus flavus]MBS2970874.1 VOC family protein [Metabacillus flavus]